MTAVSRNITIFVLSSSKLQASFHYKRDGDDDDDGVRGIGYSLKCHY